MEVVIRRYVNCDHRGMHVVSSDTQSGCGFGEGRSIGIEGPGVCRENIPHIVTLPPPASAVDARQVEANDSFR